MSKVRRLVGRDRGRGVQYKMFTGDQGREGLIRHWHVLHGAGLDERACWQLLSAAPGEGLRGVEGEAMSRHCSNSV